MLKTVTSMAVQWLRLRTCNARCLTSGQATEIPQAARHGQENKMLKRAVCFPL